MQINSGLFKQQEFGLVDNDFFFVFVCYYFIEEFFDLIHFKWVQRYGKIYRAWGGLQAMVIISAPELMEVRIM